MTARWVEMVPLDAVVPYAGNAKQHDLGAILGSVAEFGFVEPMVVDDRTGVLVSGHGRLDTLKAMQREGKVAPDGVEVTESGGWLVPVVHGWSSATDGQARALTLALNRAGQLGGWDEPRLCEELQSLAMSGDLDATGFDGDDIDKLIRDLGNEVIAGGSDEALGGGGLAQCPRCGEEFKP